jgi:hypothetical protein
MDEDYPCQGLHDVVMKAGQSLSIPPGSEHPVGLELGQSKRILGSNTRSKRQQKKGI